MLQPKKSLNRIKPYVNGRHSGAMLSEKARVMKLDSNESTVSASPRVVAALTSFIQAGPLNWYPDIESTKLIKKLVTYTGCPKENIQTFNGSDNALETICRTFVEPGDEVILCMPTYDHFRLYAESCDATLIQVYGENAFEPKPEKIIATITPKTKIVYIVSPNNPTGMMYSSDDIEGIAKAAPHALVIVDEAYFEFCGITMAHLVGKYRNIVVSRSFSKAFGLAALRCGYVLAHECILEAINKIRVGKSINSLAQVAACAALDDLEHMEHYVSEVTMARQWIVAKMRALGLKVYETPANFILLEVAHPRKVEAFLESQKIFIRDRSFMTQLEGTLRITIGHQLMMERFWKSFEKIPMEYLFSKASQEKETLAN